MTGMTLVSGEICKNPEKVKVVVKLAKPASDETKREKTRKSLENALKVNKLKEDFLKDKVDEYMSFYDNLKYIDKELKSGHINSMSGYTNATAEKRRISGEMRNILTFLGLKPAEVTLSSGGDDDEEL